MFFLKSTNYKENLEAIQKKSGLSAEGLDSRVVLNIFQTLTWHKKVIQNTVFVIGPGHNGRLGLLLAKRFVENRVRVQIFLPNVHLQKQAHLLFEQKHLAYITFFEFEAFNSENLNDALMIDALFHTNCYNPLPEMYETIINKINSSKNEVISLLAPSGTHSHFVQSDFILTLPFAVEDILNKGFSPQSLLYTEESLFTILKKGLPKISARFYESYTPTLSAKSHKYSRGTAITVGGLDFFGASILALKAGQRYNACMQIHFSQILDKYPLLTAIPEVVFHNIEHFKEVFTLHNPSSLTIGFGSHPHTLLTTVFHEAVQSSTPFPIVLDGGALALFHILNQENAEHHPLILTPHVGEFSKMLGISSDEILNNKIHIAQKFARDHNVILILKGFNTIVTNGIQTWVNPISTPLLSTPGTGDVLSGMLSTRLNLNDETALFHQVCQTVYFHTFVAKQLEYQGIKNISASTMILNI